MELDGERFGSGHIGMWQTSSHAHFWAQVVVRGVQPRYAKRREMVVFQDRISGKNDGKELEMSDLAVYLEEDKAMELKSLSQSRSMLKPIVIMVAQIEERTSSMD